MLLVAVTSFDPGNKLPSDGDPPGFYFLLGVAFGLAEIPILQVLCPETLVPELFALSSSTIVTLLSCCGPDQLLHSLSDVYLQTSVFLFVSL